ncbi:ITGA7 [Lepeophtheirus salmonis]|uniref:ITGA7 n=1 Tax=Lepeophtheirus salmonis TaxID=72036 RepID=A0A7R8CT80_LEPSM|nr:ITGA7 [Lepeophtheirus salmonis]CAF2924125.1 ITGA7 [Lepeophtheirus salmonis]
MTTNTLFFSSSAFFSWFLLLTFFLQPTLHFNLEPRIGIIKKGNPGSYFGFSVASHVILSPSRSPESVILVGAPLDRRRPDTDEEGSLWKCSFTSSPNDCDQINNYGGIYGDQGESSGQWLGVAVHSQGPGKQVIVCAHRYVKKEFQHRWGNGRCFTLSQNLEHLATWDPCEGRDKKKLMNPGAIARLVQVHSLQMTTQPLSALLVPSRGGARFSPCPSKMTSFFVTKLIIILQSRMGMLLCGQRLSYASGAPRDGSSGKVFIFFWLLSLSTVDLNGDGYFELIVGAPFYSGTGAVYIYKNTANGIEFDAQRRVLLPNKRSPRESRFGFAVADGGDLNNDGKNDLLVGAPYDGNGKVFVYMGNNDDEEGEEIVRLGQIIESESLPHVEPIRTFGYSLSGGVDIDMNNHSDIVVGAYESDIAVIIRSRPVIDIITWFGKRPRVIDPTLKGCESDLMSDEVCFGIESCFLIKNFPPNIETTHIKYTLDAEIFPGGRRVSRVRFGDKRSNSSYQSEKIIAVERDSLTGCFYETAYLREGTLDIRNPIKFLLTLKLQQDEPRLGRGRRGFIPPPPNINQFPILNAQEAQKHLDIPFQKSCGDDDLCHSQLSATILVDGANDVGVLEVRDRKEVAFSVQIRNDGEPAYTATVLIEIDPHSFNFVGRSDSNKDINCEYLRSQKIVCDLGNPYGANRTDNLLFRVIPKKTIGSRLVYFNTTTNTTSEDIAQSRISNLRLQIAKRAEVSIRSSVHPNEIWYGGSVLGESAMKFISDVGTKVTHTFQVFNEGPWHVQELDIVIDWPYQLKPPLIPPHYNTTSKEGKWLLYLSETPEVLPTGAGQCFLGSRAVNALGLSMRRHGGGYRTPLEEASSNKYLYSRRSSERLLYRPRRSLLEPLSGSHQLDCDSCLCHSFTCRLYDLRANEMSIVTSARIILPDDLDQSRENDHTAVPILGHPFLVEGIDAVPIWIILLSVLIGLIVVSCISMLLWKLGFFRRSRYGAISSDEDDVMISAKISSGPLKGDEYIS